MGALDRAVTGLTLFKKDLNARGLVDTRVALALDYLHGLQALMNSGQTAIRGEHAWRYPRELAEANEFIQIHRYLENTWEIVPTGLWSRIMEEPADPFVEKSNFPRSFQYELYLASLLHKAGIGATWSGSNSEPDCRFTFGGQSFLIEAKRPTSSVSVGNAIDLARKQLLKRLRVERDAVGIVAISLNLALIQELRAQSVARSAEVLPAGDRLGITKFGIEFIRDLMPEITDSLNRLVGHDLLIGVFVTLDYPAIELKPEAADDRTASSLVGTLIETTTVPEHQELTTLILNAIENSEPEAMMPFEFREGAIQRLLEASQSCSDPNF